MINGQLRPTYLKTRGVRRPIPDSGPDMRDTCKEWMRLARWLHKHRITSLADCTDTYGGPTSPNAEQGLPRTRGEDLLAG